MAEATLRTSPKNQDEVQDAIGEWAHKEGVPFIEEQPPTGIERMVVPLPAMAEMCGNGMRVEAKPRKIDTLPEVAKEKGLAASMERKGVCTGIRVELPFGEEEKGNPQTYLPWRQYTKMAMKDDVARISTYRDIGGKGDQRNAPQGVLGTNDVEWPRSLVQELMIKMFGEGHRPFHCKANSEELVQELTPKAWNKQRDGREEYVQRVPSLFDEELRQAGANEVSINNVPGKNVRSIMSDALKLDELGRVRPRKGNVPEAYIYTPQEKRTWKTEAKVAETTPQIQDFEETNLL